MKSFVLACGAGLLTLASMSAQEFNKFTFDFGAGFTTGVGNTGRFLDEGWNIHGGFGYNFSPYAGAMLNVGADSLDINDATLGNIGVPGGDVRIFHATIDPILHLTPKRRVDFYVTGGGGLFHRFQEFTAPTVVTTTAFVPFFGLYPVSFGANQVLASYSVNKPGYDVGAGLEFGGLKRGKFYAEARYDHMFLNNGHTDFVPVTFGFRW
ncbi:MAG TPA: outer membrane beta-barrel protein [Bryobacteraceae bacterium]|jgi:hypothetical protein|nr:outer membrane beta-barrel protein [Bryobacteraceae bacterium]